MPRLRYRIPQEGERVTITGGDEEGRVGTVVEWDTDRDILFVDLDPAARPWRPGFVLSSHPLAVVALGDQDEAPREMEPCTYLAHRHTDWRLAGSQLVQCGVCHPPADGIAALYVHGGQEVDAEDRASAHQVAGLIRCERDGGEA